MKLRKIKYLIGEGIKSIWANRLMSLASVGVLIACMLLIGIAVALSFNIDKAMGNLEQQNVVMAYFKDKNWAVNNGIIDGSVTTDDTSSGTTSSEETSSNEEDGEGEAEETPEVKPEDLYVIHNDEEGKALCEKLAAIDNVVSAEYISSADGLSSILSTMPKAQQEYFSEWLSEDNPLSACARITMEDLSKFDETLKQIEATEGIDVTYHQRDIAMKITSIEQALSVAGVWIIGILLLISMVIVANTIRVTMYNRKLEISIMKAVGATNRFIRFPFVVEGVFLGITSSVITTGVLYFVYNAVIETIKDSLGLGEVVAFSDFVWQVLGIFLAIGTITGIFGSLIMISKYLRKEGSEFSAI